VEGASIFVTDMDADGLDRARAGAPSRSAWIHTEQLREHGGLPGVRDETGLESALSRAANKWHYGGVTDVPSLAAAYGFGLVRNHPYLDGNKRLGFLAMVTFLGINGYELHARDAEVISEIVALAEGRVSEDELADWIREHTSKSR
jgi:death-on-curing protein